MSCPNLFLIGAHKAGTTSLYEMLVRHRSIWGPDLKEPGFFSLLGADPSVAARDEYLSRYSPSACPSSKDARYRIDGSTSYSQTVRYPWVVPSISRLAPGDVRFVYLVRDPIERMRSGYLQLRSEPRNDLPADIDRAIDRLIEPTWYRTHYDSFVSTFGAQSVFVASFERFSANPAQVASNIVQWLDLPDFDVEAVHANEAGLRRQNLAFVDRLLGHEPIRRACNELVDSPLGPPLKQLHRLVSRPVEKPELTREMLGPRWHRLAEEAHAMLSLLDEPTAHWPSLQK